MMGLASGYRQKVLILRTDLGTTPLDLSWPVLRTCRAIYVFALIPKRSTGMLFIIDI